MIWLGGQGLGKNRIEILFKEEVWGRGIWMSLLEWAQSVKIVTSHINEHQRASTMEKDLNELDKMFCPVDVSQPQFLTQWTPEQNGHGSMRGV